MDEDTKKYIAYLAEMILKVECGEGLSFSELQSLANIRDELGYWNLSEKEFRW